MIIGVPVFAVIFYIIRNILNYALKRKQLPQDSESYIFAEKLDTDQNQLICFQKDQEEVQKKDKKKSRLLEKMTDKKGHKKK